jgi:hypothetical protein
VAADRFERANAAIDAANAADPVTLTTPEGPRPKELVHAEVMVSWLSRVDPSASDVQLLAARAHHLRRWAIPRTDFPDGRAGYLRWRTAHKARQAEEVTALLTAAGYSTDEAARVAAIVSKQGLGADAEVQAHEDALCLTFLELQLDELADQLGAEHTVEVIRKTARKMSPAGLALAAEVPLSDAGADLVARALAGPEQP